MNKSAFRLIFCIVFGSLSVVKSQTGPAFPELLKSDTLILDFMKKWNIRGGSVAIAREGKLIYNRGFGFSDLAQTKPAQPGDLYRIASVTKPITAIAIMKLAEEQKLKLTDTVFGENRILDQHYYLSAINDERIYSITVQQLLEHTAGWNRATTFPAFADFDAPFFPLQIADIEDAPNPVGDSVLIRFSLHTGLQFEPGNGYAYSNIGYLVLGKIIEKVSGLKYYDYLNEHIFKPLSIADIRKGHSLYEEKLERETEYEGARKVPSCYGDGSLIPCQYGGFNLEAMNAHGGLVATAHDLVKLVLAVDGFDTRPDILNSNSVNLMTVSSGINRNYAKGWCISNNKHWWHTGSLDGTSAYICRTNNGYTWAFLFNSRADNSPEFWNSLDKLPWNCLKSINSYPDIDLFHPAQSISGLSATKHSPFAARITWKNGSGDGRLILISEDSIFNDLPEHGINYENGTTTGGSSTVIFNGIKNNILIQGLNPAKSYYLKAFEYFKNEETGGKEIYNPSGSAVLRVRLDDMASNQAMRP
jgi:CubicO group peptidase (beta-lactamase class C family)